VSRHRLIVEKILAKLDLLDETIEDLSAEIDRLITPFAAELDLLDTITGVDRRAAECIIAESGRTAALLRRSPLEPCVPLVAAHGSSKPRGRRGVRCWQPASVSLKLAVAGGVCQVGSIAAQPISLILVGEIVGGNGPADDV